MTCVGHLVLKLGVEPNVYIVNADRIYHSTVVSEPVNTYRTRPRVTENPPKVTKPSDLLAFCSLRFMPGQLFSSCSARDLSLSLLHGGGMCLFNVPQPDELLGGPRCGNLYVEKGEQCDCGLLDVRVALQSVRANPLV